MTKFYREQKVELFYFTDPLCFHCWIYEPYLNKFLQLYHDYLDLHILMGAKPSEKETVSHQLPSKAFRVFSSVAPQKSLSFLRQIRSALFMGQMDVQQEKNLLSLIQSQGERGGEILSRCKLPEGERRLMEDQRLGKRFSITEIPSLVLVHDGKIEKIVGAFNEEKLEEELIKILGFKPEKSKPRPLLEELKASGRLHLRDLLVLYELEEEEMTHYVAKELKGKTYRWVSCENGCYLELFHE